MLQLITCCLKMHWHPLNRSGYYRYLGHNHCNVQPLTSLSPSKILTLRMAGGSPDRGSHLPDNSRRLGQAGFNLVPRIIIYPFLLTARHLAREALPPLMDFPCKALFSLAGRPGICWDGLSDVRRGLVALPAACTRTAELGGPR